MKVARMPVPNKRLAPFFLPQAQHKKNESQASAVTCKRKRPLKLEKAV